MPDQESAWFGELMTRLAIIVVSISLIMATFVGLLSHADGQGCPTCGRAEEYDWISSAADFIAGKPANETPPIFPPLAARQNNPRYMAGFGSEWNKASAASASNESKTPLVEQKILDVALENVSASPNPVNPNNPVMITAILRRPISNADKNETGSTFSAYASMRNSAGNEIDRINLVPLSNETYAGIWNANKAGIYRATIVASSPDASKIFNDALQIDVSETSGTPGNATVIPFPASSK
jgi:hypothetical protein